MTALAYATSFHTQSIAVSDMGTKIAALLAKATSHSRNVATDWRPLTKALIEQVALECSAADWDGYGAAPIAEGAKNFAQYFVDQLPYHFPAPEPVPDPDGELALSWDFGPGHIFTLSISANGTLSYAGLLGEGIKRHGMEPFKGDIPKTILESISELCDRSRVAA